MKPSQTSMLATGLAAGIAVLVGLSGPLRAEGLPAFPGAEGFGASTVGGRGGRVIKVTNLNAKGPGSLQAAVQAEGARIVVFDVSGVIRGNVVISQPRLTIAGQTAPGAGITIEGMLCTQYRVQPPVKQIIVRFLRIRRDRHFGVSGDAIQFSRVTNIMLDHLSLCWSNDEAIDLGGCSSATVQWCTIEESDTAGHRKPGQHNYGPLIWGRGSGKISLHHNLLAHHSRRNPGLMPQVPDWPGDFRNNVVYDFREGLSREGRTEMAALNLINNYYKRGPGARNIRLFSLTPKVQYYIRGNYVEGVGLIGDPREPRTRWPRWMQRDTQGEVLAEPAAVAPVKTHTAREAYRLVLARAGCFPRDRVTRRTIEEVIKGTGKWGRNAPLKPPDEWYMQGLSPARPPEDTDDDGMPDEWEKARRLNPRDAADASKKMPSGYTAIEEYVNQRADRLIRRYARQDASTSRPSRPREQTPGSK